jgi:GT2 family glycosyltransferase/peptidoglycan/xylan/chitin deacetylase (PgdA/CDA1 family)
MNCSVVIPTRLRAQILRETLDSLALQTESSFEVIVVCDGEDPDTRRLAEGYTAAFPVHWISLPDNRGKALARNIGATAARNELLIFLDDDTSPVPDWIFHHRRSHESVAGKIAIVGRVIENYQRPPRSRTEQLLRSHRLQFLKSYEKTISRNNLPSNAHLAYINKFFGVNCSILRKDFLDIGGFDPDLTYIEEDTELGARLYDRGVLFRFQSKAAVEHRDTKDLLEYSSKCWSMTGSVHVLRALQKGQRNPQTAAMTGVQSRNPLRRMKVALAWNHPELLRKPALSLQAITDATGLRLPFRLWCSAMVSTAYWQRVRAQGLSLEGLREVVGRPLPIISFHSISSAGPKRWKYHVAPERFWHLITKMRERNYTFVFPDNHASLSREVALTFDDGYEDFYFNVFPRMEDFGLKPLIFLVVDRIGQTNRWDRIRSAPARRLLSLAQIREMSHRGVQFGSHSMTHASLPQLSYGELRREVTDSKSALEDLLGREVSTFAYPYGAHDERVRAAVAEAGYKLAFSTRWGLHHWGDPLSISRLEIFSRDSWLEVQFKVATGHSLRAELSKVTNNLARAALRVLPRDWSSYLIAAYRKSRLPDYNAS